MATQNTNHEAVRKAGAPITITVQRAADPTNDLEMVRRGEFTKQQLADPFANYGSGRFTEHWNVIAPPMNLNSLLRMTMENSVLKQCVDVMVTNIPGHGYRLEYVGPDNGRDTTEAKNEEAFIKAFMDYPNEDYSVVEMRKRLRWDLETFGNAYIEVARDKKGRVSAVWHLPSHMVRATEMDKEPTSVEVTLPRIDGPVTRKISKHFRRYVQIKAEKKVFFKEYGDPRYIDPATGQENKALGLEETATEVIHMSLYHAGSVYGLPRWINNIVAIQGSRQAELTNLDYFSENAIPAMMLMVSGGSVTQNSLLSLENQVTSARGRAAQHRVVVIEAYGDQDAASDDGTVPPPRVEVKPLAGDRPQDGQFLEYDAAQTSKVRSSFRFPPIFLGLSEDYTRATAATSYEVAEGQIFGPERVVEDDIVNRKLLGGYGLKYWQVRSNPPRISDHELMLKAVTAFEASGAMTPNIVIGMANELFDTDIPEVTEEWGNFPFTVVKGMAMRGTLRGWEKLGFVLNEKPAQDKAVKPVAGDAKQEVAKAVGDVVYAQLAELRTVLRGVAQTEKINRSVRHRESAPQAMAA